MKRILLISDDFDLRIKAVSLLGDHYTLSFAEADQSALLLALHRLPVDIAVCDCRGRRGAVADDVQRWIRRSPDAPGVRLFALLDAEADIPAGFDGLLPSLASRHVEQACALGQDVADMPANHPLRQVWPYKWGRKAPESAPMSGFQYVKNFFLSRSFLG